MTAQTISSALWFLPFALPIAIWVAWSDMARMKIPNKAVIALVAVFAVIGLIALPLDSYGWRWVHLVVVLAIGFVANMAGLLGAGDAKFAAAMGPFILREDLILFFYLFAATLIAGFAIHRIARQVPAIRARAQDWESWERKDFPMGLCLGGALVFYLVIGAVWGV
ncbi:prepilin peptidase [Sinisalibacter aestuarii]|uniref:Membrane protein n=1 Tax=Sinisalibacter aestuarii TaxID=2949426 RepID=A0ABQ5LXB7_9RHOB|nr:prepilin peptidase [Sinisalibacter aestuarii]GKY89413.1 membrane protein [Sinisalibacter aestuarii]